MIGEKAKMAITEESVTKVLVPYVSISLNSKPLLKEENPEDVVQTLFKYFVRHKPSSNKGRKNRPFIISCDLIKAGQTGDNLRVSCYEDLLESAKTNKGVRWLINHSELSPELFEIAKINTGCFIQIPVNLAKYFKDINDPERLGKYPEMIEIERLRTKHHLEQAGITDVEV